MAKKKRSRAKRRTDHGARTGKRRSQQAQRSPGSSTESTFGQGPFELVEYEIITEPMPDPCFDQLTPQEFEDLEWVASRLKQVPRRCIEILEPLLKKYPDFPTIYNYLSVAYAAAGRTDEALELNEETYRRFPKYLFARINKAMRCLQEDRADEVPAIFDHQFSLHRLYPERRGKFHLSEFVQFNALMAIYYSQVGNSNAAESFLRMAEELDPQHPAVRLAREIVHPRTVLDTLADMISMGRSRQKPRSPWKRRGPAE